MKIYIILYIYLLFTKNVICQPELKISFINNKDYSVKNAVYSIRNREGNYSFQFPFFIKVAQRYLIKNYLLIKENDNGEDYFYIKDNFSNKLLSAYNDKITNYNDLENVEKDYALWKIIPKINEENNLVFYVQNKKTKAFWNFIDSSENKYIQLKNVSIINNYNEFQFNELYKEVEKKESKILEKEPIDVLIKYIDLTDLKLNRLGIKQIKKDQDNQELKYSLRSIFKNIPWIRKIFILMPNERVKFLKSQEEIKEKIIFVKDKDLLGFNTASPSIFQFNLHKMKKFGLSENFILMDDDYFIAKPINKSEFFYEENGEVLPSLVTSDYYEMNKDEIKNILSKIIDKNENINPNSQNGFIVKQNNALLLLYEIFGNDDIRNGKKLVEPAFTHNAIPVKMSEIEEIHNHILRYYKYANLTFFSKMRTIYDLQMQTFYMCYVKNKYDRKVSKISSNYFDLSHLILVKKNTKKLFVINTSLKFYNKNIFQREKVILNNLFPINNEYELVDEIEEKNFVKNEITIKSNEDIKNLSSVFIQRLKRMKNRMIDKTQSINKNISKIIEHIEDIIDKTNFIVNKTKNYQEIKEMEINYKKFLEKEIEMLKKDNIFHILMNLILLFSIIMFLIYKFCKYIKIETDVEIKDKDKIVNLNEEEILLKIIKN